MGCDGPDGNGPGEGQKRPIERLWRANDAQDWFSPPICHIRHKVGEVWQRISTSPYIWFGIFTLHIDTSEYWLILIFQLDTTLKAPLNQLGGPIRCRATSKDMLVTHPFEGIDTVADITSYSALKGWRIEEEEVTGMLWKYSMTTSIWISRSDFWDF